MSTIERLKAAQAANTAARDTLRVNLGRTTTLVANARKLLTEFVKLNALGIEGTANLRATKKKGPLQKRRKRTNVTLVDQLSTRSSRRAPTPQAVHDEQIVRTNILPFPSRGRDDRRPVSGRNLPALPPFTDDPMTYTQVVSHLRDGGPATEHVSEFHTPHNAGDGLSRQAAPIVPVTEIRPAGTIRRMGRNPTPVQFNKAFAARLRAARIAAGYDTQPPFAKALGIELERYKKWESGRTPIQHEFLAGVCELTGKDANFFYGLTLEQTQKRASAVI
jgi:hypothetical protein